MIKESKNDILIYFWLFFQSTIINRIAKNHNSLINVLGHCDKKTFIVFVKKNFKNIVNQLNTQEFQGNFHGYFVIKSVFGLLNLVFKRLLSQKI